MHRLLVINPNTSQTTTDRLAQHMPHVLATDTPCSTRGLGTGKTLRKASILIVS